MANSNSPKTVKKAPKSTSFPAKRSTKNDVIEVLPTKKVEVVSARAEPETGAKRVAAKVVPAKGKSPTVTLKSEVKLVEPDSEMPGTGTGVAVTARDPLKRYLQEVKNAPVLTAEQETELTHRMHENGDVQAAKLLVSANLKLVVRIAYEYRSMYHNLMDLIQEGNIGLMKAVSKFDPTKGARLPYYATWWVRSYILKYLLDNFRLVRVGTSQAQKKLFYHLMREKQRLEAQGIVAAPALIAQNLHVKEKDVIEMEQRLLGPGAEMSIDAPAPGHPDEPKSSLLNQLFDTRENPDSALEHDEWLQILANELVGFKKELNQKETMVLDARILNDDPKTLQEVADEFGLTRERVRQIESKLIEKLKKRLEPYLK